MESWIPNLVILVIYYGHILFTTQNLVSMKEQRAPWLVRFSALFFIVYSLGLPLPVHAQIGAWISALLLIFVLVRWKEGVFNAIFTPLVWKVYFWAITIMVVIWTINTGQVSLMASLGAAAVLACAVMVRKIRSAEESLLGAD